MVRSDFYIKLTAGVLFAAVVCYIGVYIYNGLRSSYKTVPAVSYTYEETGLASGYIVRSELPLTEKAGDVLPIVSEGEKVAAKQVIAVEYSSGSELETVSEIRALRARIEQLERLSDQETPDTPALGADSVIALSRAVHSGNYDNMETIALSISSLIFEVGGQTDRDLPTLKAELSRLEAANAGSKVVRAAVSGVFSSVTDGYEKISPDMLEGVTPTKLEEMFNTPVITTGAAGKLVHGISWYYAAIISADDAKRLTNKNSVTVQFTGAYHTTTQMTVEQIGRSENGRCVVLLSSNRGLSDIAPLRWISSEIQFSSMTGIRVPKEAIHLSDTGQTYIYLETGGRAEPVDVEIISEMGDGYLVKNGAETGTVLRSGAMIIARANDIEKGKVMR